MKINLKTQHQGAIECVEIHNKCQVWCINQHRGRKVKGGFRVSYNKVDSTVQRWFYPSTVVLAVVEEVPKGKDPKTVALEALSELELQLMKALKRKVVTITTFDKSTVISTGKSIYRRHNRTTLVPIVSASRAVCIYAIEAYPSRSRKE